MAIHAPVSRTFGGAAALHRTCSLIGGEVSRTSTFLMKRQTKLTDFCAIKPPCEKREEHRGVLFSTETPNQRMAQRRLSSGPLKSTPKRRKFSDPELHALVDEIITHLGKLFGPHKCNASEQAAIWERVVKRVNEAGSEKRKLIDCKKRWSDYKRKIKHNLSYRSWDPMTGQQEPLESILSRRQVIIAQFFQMDKEDSNNIQELPDDFSLKEVPFSNSVLVSPDSEEDFVISSKRSSASNSFMENVPLEHPSPSSDISESILAGAPGSPVEATPVLSSEQPVAFDTKLDQLIAQQKTTNKILRKLHRDIRAFLDLQEKTFHFLKQNLVAQRRSVTSGQKLPRGHGKLPDRSLKCLHNKSDGLNSTFAQESFQSLQSSEESDEGKSSFPGIIEEEQRRKKRPSDGRASQSPRAKTKNITPGGTFSSTQTFGGGNI